MQIMLLQNWVHGKGPVNGLGLVNGLGTKSPGSWNAFWHLQHTILSIICSYTAEFMLRFYVPIEATVVKTTEPGLTWPYLPD